MADRLLFLEEVADILRRSPGALRYMVHAGTAPPSAKIAGRRMWRESEVYAWLEAQFADTNA
ncbi:hypothetical protein AS25_03180 [Kocuria marina]|uniref:Helix-turn-helix domain-containing protein n=1 Tax=Kocuria marina TaxID=223184 RepID=A0A0B0DF89_9MICC|nr:helix-turn-helix domain-containing protein [Kocuria marina]KHE74837.1 hypothetical protein AS25_03180 [Kocuria marina]